MSADENSGYITSITAENIPTEFTDVNIIHTSEYNVLARAQRYGRWFMLKGLNTEGHDETLLRQMQRKEFEILIQLQHPNVVQTIGLEQVPGLGSCIVMEHIDGTTLKECPSVFPSGRAAPTVEILRILDELLQSVAYIHSLGIVHRDLKPQNIMLTRNGQHVKLIDFGLADTDSYSMLKQQAGTKRYMAPEQTATVPTAFPAATTAPTAFPADHGQATAGLDLRNDIYSLGVIMSELPLPASYQKVWSRCLLPIDKRYQSVAELQADIAKLQTRKTRMINWGVAAVIAALLVVVGLLLWRVQVMDSEINRVAYAKTKAIEELHQQMEQTQLTQHTDTLTQWEYRWPDLTQRVMAVNQFCYDYTDRLDQTFTSDDRDRIREALLSEWQQWQQRIYALATAKVATKRREARKKELNAE